ncbi:MAG: hypothetical protein AB7F66_04720 [Bacteriovoracia bacterium]
MGLKGFALLGIAGLLGLGCSVEQNRSPDQTSFPALDPTSDPSDEPTPSVRLLQGAVDSRLTAETLSGWVVDPARPLDPTFVDLYIDGGSPIFLLANQPREGTGNPGSHGFFYEIPGALKDGQLHRIVVRGKTLNTGQSEELPGSPFSFRLSIPAGNQMPQGALLSVTGPEVSGWAADPDAADEPIRVRFYISTGFPLDLANLASLPSAGTVVANDSRTAGAIPGAHGFTFTPPIQYQDGIEHSIDAFAIDPSTGTLQRLPGSPLSYRHESNPARGYFNSQVAPLLTCVGCHGFEMNDYSRARPHLLSPPPPEGTRMNNRYFLKASGGLAHGGGNQCATTDLCERIQTWWDLENPN